MSSPPPVTLTIRNNQGVQESVVLTGPGGTIRIAVGEPGNRSGIWRVWATPNNSDVYVAIRNIAGYQKVSLHQSGKWRFGWVSDHRAREFGHTGDRAIEKWLQPPELGESGWTRGLSIWVRHQDITPVDDASLSKANEVIWVPPAQEGHAIGIYVIIARPDHPETELQGGVPFTGFTLADGRVVLLVATTQPITDHQTRMIETTIAAAMAAKPAGVDLDAVSAPRMLAWGDGPDGIKRAWDVAVTARN